jgi:glycosyltransferase involved in cell wall biosynthesis
MNRQSFKEAHRIFTISENLALEISKYIPGDKSMLKVVPNWVDSKEIKPVPKEDNPFIKQMGLEGKFIVMYSGNMGQTHDLETIVETAKELVQMPQIQFLLIGDGAKKVKISSMVSELNLTNVVLHPFQKPAMFKYSIACADIGFVTLAEGFEFYSVPSKTYYLMAAGCIVFAIANEKSEVQNLLEKFNFGYRFNSGAAIEIANKIREIYLNRELVKILGENARNAAAHFTSENATIIANEVASR